MRDKDTTPFIRKLSPRPFIASPEAGHPAWQTIPSIGKGADHPLFPSKSMGPSLRLKQPSTHAHGRPSLKHTALDCSYFYLLASLNELNIFSAS